MNLKVLPDLSKARLLVVGDVMLDRYWFGDVSRISPEAPVPIVRVERTEERPGGASNVARNATALGARVTLLSVVGDDEAGARLLQLVEDEHIIACLHKDPGIPTTVKLRVVGRQQQLLRIDFETQPSHEVLAQKLTEFEALLAGCDVLVLSDYGKGGLTHIARMIELAHASGKVILVDPKGDDFSRYRGATIVTPNRAELREVVGRWKDEEDLTRRAQALRRELGAQALLLTRSEDGMSLYQESGVVHQTTKAREVFDVSGAGDTVMAALAAMLASGATLPDAVHVANCAAGIVVGKLGTAVVDREELQAALAQG
ncbi:MAG: D-glycero-beta-D-manno-heptose-7-phosphate kinase [Pseudomonadota bacterium]